MSDWEHLDKNRVRDGAFGSSPGDGFNGVFTLIVYQEYLRVIASDVAGWKHVSISRIDKPKIVPTWAMMCAIKDLFFEPEDWVCQFHPAKSQYVNNHPGCLHLWKPDAGMPTPQPISTGYRPGKLQDDLKQLKEMS